MKKNVFKLVSVILMGISLTGCTILSDLGIGGRRDITKMAKYKNEVTLSEFLNRIKTSTKDSEYAKEGYRIGDSKLMAGVKATAKQKLENDKIKNKVRNEIAAKFNFSADGSYDKDNNSIAATASLSYNYSEKNALIGESSSKLDGKYDFTFMPNGNDRFALADNKNQWYTNINTGNEFDLNSVLSLGLNTVMNTASNYVPETFDEAEMNKTLENLGLKLRYFDDDNVLTVTGTLEHGFDIYSVSYTSSGESGSTRVETNFARGEIKAEFAVQFKVVKVIKLRAEANATCEVNYFKDNAAAGSNILQIFGVTGFAGQCLAGDKETISLDFEAGINLESEDVTNKLPNLSDYTYISESNGDSEGIGYNW